MLVNMGQNWKGKNSSNCFNRPPPPRTKLHSSLPLLQLNSKVGLFLSIALNLHSNVLERVDIFLGELAPTLLLALHRPAGSLRVGGRVGFLYSCHTPRSAEKIIRLSDYQFIRPWGFWAKRGVVLICRSFHWPTKVRSKKGEEGLQKGKVKNLSQS